MEIIKPGYVRVSQILNNMRDHTDVDPYMLEVKGRIGTEVHKNIAAVKSDGIPIFHDYPVIHPWSGETIRWEERGLGYFLSFSEWDKAYNPHFKLMEHRLYDDDYMITGQIDALVTFGIDDKPVLIDFKCSYNPDKILWNMQAHFYWYLLKRNGIDVSDTFTWINLKKDGKKPTTHDFQFDANVLARCLHEATKYHEEYSQAIMFD